MRHLNEIELVMTLDGELEAPELAMAQAHVSECVECGAKFERLRATSERVREYQRRLYSRPSLAPNHEAGRVAQSGVPVRVSSFGFRVSSWGFAAAAVVVLAVGIPIFVRSNTFHPIDQQRADKGGARNVNSKSNAGSFVAKGAPQDDNSCESGAKKSNADCATNSHPSGKGGPQSGAPGVSRPSFDAHLAQSGAPIKRLTTQKRTPAAAKPETTLAQFTELPFSDTSLPLDDATVVRVQLPAAALRQAGVPVEEDNANAMLQADVVLGIDGLPRGIRLVRANTAANHAGTN